MSAIYWGYQGQWGPVDPTVLYRFSDSSAKRAFRLSRHDRKAESAHWVPFSVFFGTNLLLRALLLAESTNWNRSTGLSEGYDTGGTLMVRNPVGNQGKSAKSGNQKSSCAVRRWFWSYVRCYSQSRICWHFLALVHRQAAKRSHSSPLLPNEKPPP